jgi:peroxiredoxin Q/BCP
VEPHRISAKKHGLPFNLLSDEGGKVRKLYGVSNTFGLFPGRVTYVLDEKGVIRQGFAFQLGARRHVDEALKILPSIGCHNGTYRTLTVLFTTGYQS